MFYPRTHCISGVQIPPFWRFVSTRVWSTEVYQDTCPGILQYLVYFRSVLQTRVHIRVQFVPYKSVSIDMKLVCVKVESLEVVLRIPPAGQWVFHSFPLLIQDVITEGIPKILSGQDSPSEKLTQLMKDCVLILCTWSILDPRFKMIQHTTPEFTEPMIDMKSVFEFELPSRCLEESQDPVVYSHLPTVLGLQVSKTYSFFITVCCLFHFVYY